MSITPESSVSYLWETLTYSVSLTPALNSSKPGSKHSSYAFNSVTIIGQHLSILTRVSTSQILE